MREASECSGGEGESHTIHWIPPPPSVFLVLEAPLLRSGPQLCLQKGAEGPRSEGRLGTADSNIAFDSLGRSWGEELSEGKKPFLKFSFLPNKNVLGFFTIKFGLVVWVPFKFPFIGNLRKTVGQKSQTSNIFSKQEPNDPGVYRRVCIRWLSFEIPSYQQRALLLVSLWMGERACPLESQIRSVQPSGRGACQSCMFSGSRDMAG